MAGDKVSEALRDTRTVVVRTRDRVAAMIREDGLRPGDRLPTEAELTQRFAISRPAMREALKLLEQDRVIFVEHGRGRFVSPLAAVKVDRPITAFESVTEMTRQYGYDTTTRLLAAEEEPASAAVAGQLGLAEGAAVLRLEKLRILGELPILYSIEFLPRAILPPDLSGTDWQDSLLGILHRRGQRPRMSAATVSAVLLPDEVVIRHGLAGFGPALLITETCYNPAGVPVIHAIDYHRGSHFSFSFMRK